MDFCKRKKKVPEKFLACMGVLENSNMQWEKSKKNQEKKKMMEGDYEMRTDLPLARVRRLESDERDLSPAMITTARLVLENWTRTSLQPYATPSSNVFSLIVWS